MARARWARVMAMRIDLVDGEEMMRAKVMDMVTDPGRVRATDPGRPEVCSAFHYREIFDVENAEDVAGACRNGYGNGV